MKEFVLGVTACVTGFTLYDLFEYSVKKIFKKY